MKMSDLKDAAKQRLNETGKRLRYKAQEVGMDIGYRLDAQREKRGLHVSLPKNAEINPDLGRSLKELGAALIEEAIASKGEQPAALQHLRREGREFREEAAHSGLRSAQVIHNITEAGFAGSEGDVKLGKAAGYVFESMAKRMNARKTEYADQPGATPAIKMAAGAFTMLAETSRMEGFAAVQEQLDHAKRNGSLKYEAGITQHQAETARRALLQMAQGNLTVDQTVSRIDRASGKDMIGYEQTLSDVLAAQQQVIVGERKGNSLPARNELKAIAKTTSPKALLAHFPQSEDYSRNAKALLSSVLPLPADPAHPASQAEKNLVVLASLVHSKSPSSIQGARQLLVETAARDTPIIGRFRKTTSLEQAGMTPDFAATALKTIDKVLTGQMPVTKAPDVIVSAVDAPPELKAAVANNGAAVASEKPFWGPGRIALGMGGLVLLAGAVVFSNDEVGKSAPAAPAPTGATTPSKAPEAASSPTLSERLSKFWSNKPEPKVDPVLQPNPKSWDIVIPEDEPAKPAAPASSVRPFNQRSSSGVVTPAPAVAPAKPAASAPQAGTQQKLDMRKLV